MLKFLEINVSSKLLNEWNDATFVRYLPTPEYRGNNEKKKYKIINKKIFNFFLSGDPASDGQVPRAADDFQRE